MADMTDTQRLIVRMDRFDEAVTDIKDSLHAMKEILKESLLQKETVSRLHERLDKIESGGDDVRDLRADYEKGKAAVGAVWKVFSVAGFIIIGLGTVAYERISNIPVMEQRMQQHERDIVRLEAAIEKLESRRSQGGMSSGHTRADELRPPMLIRV